MPDGQSLEFSGVTKRFGAIAAVSGLTARVEPGQVTGFLGPNGAGKTTSLRILLGLVRATQGTATIGGVPYAKLARPLQTVGAVLEASSFHPGRTAANHLLVYAQAAGISKARVDEVLALVGLADAAGRKVGGFSLGMRQRLGLAYALLGDPGVLVLDEPANGLDPEGIRWMRGFLRELAREGRTVLVSSHLLTEVQQTVDALLIISAGRLVFQGSLDELADPSEYATVVDAPDRAALSAALTAADVPFEVLRSGLTVRGADPAAVGAAAAAGGVALSSLHRRGPALEEVFLDLVNGTRVHASAGGALDAAIVAAAAAAAVPQPAEQAEETTDASAPVAAETEAVTAEAPADAESTAGAAAVAGVAAAAAQADGAEDSPAEPAGPSVGETDTGPDEGPADDAAEEEADGEEGTAGEDAEAALIAAELDAEATGAPGAATALGAAAGAAWAAGSDGQAEQAEVPGDAEAATFAVAGTGIIDIVPAAAAAEDATETEGHAEADAAEPADATEAAGETGPSEAAEAATDPESAPEAESPEPAHPTYAVAGTGIIDVVPPTTETEPPADADPDVEAIGDLDDELSLTSPPESEDDRPWESTEKTDADLEADRFFAAFDAERAAEEAARADADAAEPEPGHEAEAESEPEPEPAPGPESEPEPEPAPAPEPESEPEPQSDQQSEPAQDDLAEASTPSDGDDVDGLGTLADLSPDWVETDVHEHRDDEGGER